VSVAELVRSLFTDYTIRTVALGASTLGIVSGVLGTFAVLRKQSLLGDAISHAALPGIALIFLLTRSKGTYILVLGAAVAGWVGTLFVLSIVRNTRIKEDTALGIVLSVFFGFGLVLLTYIQRMPIANQAGLDTFLFGQAATLIERDVIAMAVLGVSALIVVFAFWKEFKIISFDAEYGRSLGYPVRFLEILLTTLIVLAIVIGLQTVGVVLMSALIVAPASSARQWTDRLGVMVMLSGIFGAMSGVTGALISSMGAKLPTGPVIVLCMSALVAVSFLLAPNRGLLWRAYRNRTNRKKLQVDAVLEDLYILAVNDKSIDHTHPVEVIRTMSLGHGGTDRTLSELARRGWARQTGRGEWGLTDRGFELARNRFESRERGT
jgi:manganese/zinc/iron transport system permease protein